mgnify:CR=1 FL=1
MAESPFKGLLYSPEVLGGIGLLTAGLSGQNPSAAIPMIQQGMKTASMFKAMEEEEEKRKFKKLYADQVPEEDKALFNFAPVEYIKNKEFKKPQKPNFVTFVKGKESYTLDLSLPSDLVKARAYAADGFTKTNIGVQSSSLDGLTNKSNQTTAGKEIMGAEKIMETLDYMEGLYEPEFLTYLGKGKAFVAASFQKLGIEISNEDLESFMVRKGSWEAANQQFFNAYRKEITGVAAGEKEIAFLEQSVPNINDAPAIYRAKVKLQKQLTQKIIDRNKKFLATGFKQELDDKGLPTGKYKEFLEANEIKPEASQAIDYANELKALGYDNTQMNFLMNKTFGVGNWEEFFKEE